MKQRKLLLLSAIVLIVVAGISYLLFYRKDLSKSANQRALSSYCDGISETECFTKLSGCTKANSKSDFLNKKGFNIARDRSTDKITPPIKTNFPNAEIFLNIQLLGGGDYGSFPFIKLGNSYCDLNEENIKIVFAPIKNKEDALKYYLFIQKDLGSAKDQTQIYIMKKEDYENSRIKQDTRGHCDANYEEQLPNKITEATESEDGFLISLIRFNYMGRIEFIESKIKIKFDGTIELISQKTLLDCGMGYVF